MNNTVKIALALAAGSSLLYMGLRKRIKQKKVYLAPDGNTYKENQIYGTYENKLYKNGKEFHYNLPDQHDDPTSNMKSIKVSKNAPLNYTTTQKNTAYHHKGVRHH